jgi:hypothetical protein
MENKNGNDISSDECELVNFSDINNLIGKVKTLIETLGLNEKQEKAFKDTIANTIISWFRSIIRTYSDNLFNKREWYFENRNEKI